MKNLLLTTALAFITCEAGALQLIGQAGSVHVGTVTVATTRSDLGVGPETFLFEVTGMSGFVTAAPTEGEFDERWHDFAFLWDFGDPGSTFSVVQRIPEAMRSANVAYMPQAAHTYAPGTYTPSVLVVELSSGRTAYWEAEYTVADPDVYFSGKTITVNPDGGADYTTVFAALDAVKAQSDVRRIQLARGKTYSFSSRYNFSSGSWRNVYVCAASGAGARPVLHYTANAPSPGFAETVFTEVSRMTPKTPGQEIDVVWSDVKFLANWDATTESGLGGTDHTGNGSVWGFAGGTPTGAQITPGYLHFVDVEASGFSMFLATPQQMPLCIKSRFVVENWQDYGVGDSAIKDITIDARLEQLPGALSGGQKNGYHNNHGPMRTYSPAVHVKDGVEFLTANGWFPNVAGYTTEQPCERFAVDTTTVTNVGTWSRCLFEGGWQILSSRDASGSLGGYLKRQDCRIEMCFFLGSHMTNYFIDLQWGGWTIRNNHFVRPATSVISGIYDAGKVLFVQNTSLTTGDELDRILFEHNTIYNGQATAMAVTEVRNGSGLTTMNNLITRHNIVHQPNASDSWGFGLSSSNPFTPKHQAYKRRLEVFTVTIASPVAPAGTVTVSYASGSFGDGDSTSYQTPRQSITGLTSASAIFDAGSTFRLVNNSAGNWAAGTYTVTIARIPADAISVSGTATPSAEVVLLRPSTSNTATGSLVNRDYFAATRASPPQVGATEMA